MFLPSKSLERWITQSGNFQKLQEVKTKLVLEDGHVNTQSGVVETQLDLTGSASSPPATWLSRPKIGES